MPRGFRAVALAAYAVERFDRWGAQRVVVRADRYPDVAALRRGLDRVESVARVRDFGSLWLYRIRRLGA